MRFAEEAAVDGTPRAASQYLQLELRVGMVTAGSLVAKSGCQLHAAISCKNAVAAALAAV